MTTVKKLLLRNFNFKMLTGEILNDSWMLLKRIGKGSFSEIYLGHNLHIDSSNNGQDNRFVAIKVQRLSLTNDAMALTSSVLRWEADVLKSLGHHTDTNPTKITFPKFFHYDSHISPSVQQSQQNGNRYEYIVMEYLSGEDMSRLRDVTRINLGYIPIPIVFYLTFQILECIQNFHSKGLVHRDIKPANFVRRNRFSSEYCMLDFGISKQVFFFIYIYLV